MTRTYGAGEFVAEQHYYPQVLNAHIHPLVRFLFNLGNERIAERYCHLHPEASPKAIREALSARPSFFRWGGTDLFHVVTAEGRRRIVVIETNSCPSGQKSMPRLDEDHEDSGYRRLLQGVFLPMLKRRALPRGDLAVLYDKNLMEASGYAATLAELTGEPVHLVPCFADSAPTVTVEDGVLQVATADGGRPVRAAFRYVTQRPWTRLPPVSRTAVLNPVVACLAGGRNKLLAAKAYEVFNGQARDDGLRINVPETIWDVARAEVPLWVARMGGVAVVKNPYSNAGQGVWTITNEAELEAFMALEQRYDRFIVQALIGNHEWTSRGRASSLYHVGTVPDRQNRLYVADLRFMVGASPTGFFPIAIYARRARVPLRRQLDAGTDSWDMLGTNLSLKRRDGGWDSDTDRLLIMDSRNFNRLGLGLDDLIEAYLQSVLAVTAVDRMARTLVTRRGLFRRRYFASVTPDPTLCAELMT